MCLIGLIVEYSRMQVSSLGSGCEMAQFFVRHTVLYTVLYRTHETARPKACLLAVAQSKVTHPKRRFGKAEQKWNADFRRIFQGFVVQIEYSRPWKSCLASAFIFCSAFPHLRLGSIKVRLKSCTMTHPTAINAIARAVATRQHMMMNMTLQSRETSLVETTRSVVLKGRACESC